MVVWIESHQGSVIKTHADDRGHVVECVYWNTRQHVVLIEIQLNAYNYYLSQTPGIISTCFGVIYFCICGILHNWEKNYRWALNR
jgi:hypothetical protein